MSTYLDEYGAADARRERIVKILVGALLGAAVVAGLLWYFFRDYREQRLVREFLDALGEGNYQTGYQMWGCTEESPCVNYPYESFLEDWGATAIGDPELLALASKRSCSGGIIQTVHNGDEDILIWVDRQEGTLAFSPFSACHVRFAPATSTPAQ